jgi:hypothetical protein
LGVGQGRWCPKPSPGVRSPRGPAESGRSPGFALVGARPGPPPLTNLPILAGSMRAHAWLRQPVDVGECWRFGRRIVGGSAASAGRAGQYSGSRWRLTPGRQSEALTGPHEPAGAARSGDDRSRPKWRWSRTWRPALRRAVPAAEPVTPTSRSGTRPPLTDRDHGGSAVHR